MRLIGLSLVALYCGLALAFLHHAGWLWLAGLGIAGLIGGVGLWAFGVLSGRIDPFPLR